MKKYEDVTIYQYKKDKEEFFKKHGNNYKAKVALEDCCLLVFEDGATWSEITTCNKGTTMEEFGKYSKSYSFSDLKTARFRRYFCNTKVKACF